MKLASYVAGGKECYGVVVGDGVVTMKGHASLRDALAAGALDEMRKASAGSQAGPQAFRYPLPAGDPQPAQNPLRRRELQIARRRGRPRAAEAAEHVHPLHRHAGRPRGRDDPPQALGQFRFRGRADHGDRQGRPPHPDRARARPCRRLHDLRRRQRARLPEVLGHLGQELARHRPARALDRHQRRNSRSRQARR